MDTQERIKHVLEYRKAFTLDDSGCLEMNYKAFILMMSCIGIYRCKGGFIYMPDGFDPEPITISEIRYEVVNYMWDEENGHIEWVLERSEKLFSPEFLDFLILRNKAI